MRLMVLVETGRLSNLGSSKVLGVYWKKKTHRPVIL